MKVNILRLCDCGRIHVLDYDLVKSVTIDRAKKFIYVCDGCGAIKVVKAIQVDDVEIGDDSFELTFMPMMVEDSFSMYSDLDEHWYFSKGIKIPMMTGNYANRYNAGFRDTTCPDFGSIYYGETSQDKVISFIKDYEDKAVIIDTVRLIKEQPEEVLEMLAACGLIEVKNINWEECICNGEEERI